MRPNPEFPADVVTFTEEILNGKLYFLYSVYHRVYGENMLYRYILRTPAVKVKPLSNSPKNIKSDMQEVFRML